ncbi:N-methyl-L-tryptophan oxidase [Blastopirellula sp. JC732]|uniref:N-methyl-L-tryptophan oxidase n=1 Tax=Blastopirellula sediminis TaxID=2894196 RepID=A0A9X1MSL7_9BACT|nr:N-methyl-L-tryptophan oxidase [Blastopirellula sediminis]MCC9604960.1 N-methyl-L-tryptophan oxidase [Blastopirellula sediminis]MCC9631740.1 N-methyl-L-tryptophan oxidase [Blastopirellula sediminis]
MSTAPYDVLVLGAGGVGSAALYQLAKRGLRAAAIDRFQPPHIHGSSHGETRIIRQAYFEHPSYVPLLKRSYELWRELEAESQRSLYHETGLVEIGPPDGIVLPGVMRAAEQFDLEIDQLTPVEASRQFPQYLFPDDHLVAFERRAGYLLVEDCVSTFLQLAQQHSGELIGDTQILSWSRDGEGFCVSTSRGEYRAAKLIIAGGSGAVELLKQLNVPLRVLRKHLHWYAIDDLRLQEANGCPCYFFESSHGYFYGFPEITPGGGLKGAEHGGGQELASPWDYEHSADPEDQRRIAAFFQRSIPGVSKRPLRHETCLYTMTPDENFLLGLYPGEERIALAAGLSGHGFKFTAVLGEALADLVERGTSPLPLEFLAPDRFAR